jgi:putative addiction module component (TIGR02574 family)
MRYRRIMTDPKPFDYSRLSVPERILLAEEIWDSLDPDSQAMPLTPAQQEELERRLAAADRGEITYSSWDEVKRRLLSKG